MINKIPAFNLYNQTQEMVLLYFYVESC